MRLINIDTLEFEEHVGNYIPRYAILSHRWSDDEITYADYRKGRRQDSAGYRKVLDFRHAVKRYSDGWNEATLSVETGVSRPMSLSHIWIDTCCIDKRSSAELSEAINSMYHWYREALICFVHLADVHIRDTRDTVAVYEALRGSSWFTRGWTLQEMLASELIIFCDATWKSFGHKYLWNSIGHQLSSRLLPDTIHLNSELSSICDIDEYYLSHPYEAQRSDTLPAARIFSWASGRQTSRVEDIAYCLLGLLRVNMPLLYGEGRSAFVRLQLELIESTSDCSIFAFAPSMLAMNIEQFAACHGISSVWRTPTLSFAPEQDIINMKANAYQIEIDIRNPWVSCGRHAWLVPLACTSANEYGSQYQIAMIIGRAYGEDGNFSSLPWKHRMLKIDGDSFALPRSGSDLGGEAILLPEFRIDEAASPSMRSFRIPINESDEMIWR